MSEPSTQVPTMYIVVGILIGAIIVLGGMGAMLVFITYPEPEDLNDDLDLGSGETFNWNGYNFTYPNFVFRSINGSNISINSSKGSDILIHWMKNTTDVSFQYFFLKELVDKYSNERNLTIFSISPGYINESLDDLSSWATRKKISWTVGADYYGAYNSYNIQDEQKSMIFHINSGFIVENAQQGEVGLSRMEYWLTGEWNSNDSPNIRYQQLNGTYNYINQSIGRTIIIDWFATWCQPCETQIGILRNIVNAFPEVAIYSISTSPSTDSLADLTDYADDHDMNWFVGLDTDNQNDLWGVWGIPIIHLINSEFYIVEQHEGVTSYDTLAEWINNHSN